MSLTSILSDRDNQELRDKLKNEFLRPAFTLKTEIKAPPLTTNWGIVGTAFDYLMRFYLQHYNKTTFIQRDTWVADHSYETLTNKFSTTKETEIRTGFHRDKIFKTKDLLKIITDQYDQTKTNYSKFISNGQLTDDLLANTIYLAKLDAFFRAGIIDQNLDNHNPDDIKDLHSLISLVDKTQFTAKEKCYFNPTFGQGSVLVGGADADLIIDNTLIDIKATKHLKLDRDHLNQVLGYYILSLIGGVNNNPKEKPIENIGLYFARHGELWTIPLLQFGDKSKFDEFKTWFISYVSRGQMSIEDLQDLMLSIKAKPKVAKHTKPVVKEKVVTKKTATKTKTTIKKETVAKPAAKKTLATKTKTTKKK
jgi:hypothetical protein